VPRDANPFELKEPDKRQLREWVSAFGIPQQVALRCRIVLAAAEGLSDYEIAAKLQSNRKTVMLWRRRYVQEGVDALWEVAAGRGRKPTYGPEKIQAIVDTTLRSKPKGATHWSCRTLAAAQGVSKSAVNRIWQSHNLKPHRTRLSSYRATRSFSKN
jgi:transposase